MKQRAPMRKKSKPRSSSSKLSPRSAGDADFEMGRRIRLRRRETGISQIEPPGRLGVCMIALVKILHRAWTGSVV
jgi:hypothetical protein